VNANNTDAFLTYSRGKIIEQKLVEGNAAGRSDTGRISAERFQIQIKQLEDLGLLKRGAVSVESAMSDKFLP
jgi:hypothetical protein